jgi:hypothetical protein
MGPTVGPVITPTFNSRPGLRWTFGVLAAGAYVLLCLASADGSLSGDDHFSLWVAAAVAAGDRPNVDVFDPGTPLQWWVSYAGQWLTGHRTIGEIAIAILFKTIGIIAVCRLTARLTGSWLTAGAAATAVVVLSLSYQVYGWDKLFIYPVSALAALAYLDGRTRPWVLGVVAAVAGLLRHDHGLFIGLFLAATILVGPRPRVAAVAVFLAAGLGTCGPWLWWISQTEGLVEYFRARTAASAELGLLESRPLFLFGVPVWSIEGAALVVWHVAAAVPFAVAALAWTRRRVDLALLAGLLLLLEAGIMRQALQVKETAMLWVPLFAVLLSDLRRGSAAYAVRLAAVLLVVMVPVAADARTHLRWLFVDETVFDRVRSALDLHTRPVSLDFYAPASDRSERLIIRYVAVCLRAEDRVWDTSDWFSLTYYARRRSVWHPYWSEGFLNGERRERLLLAWLDRHQVPVIVVRQPDADPLMVFSRYRLVQPYVASRYREVRTPELDAFVAAGNRIRLLVDDRRTPVGTFAPLGLPCFAPQTPDRGGAGV